MTHIRLHVLGGLSIYRDETTVHISRRKAQALLAYLAITGQPHRREWLSALFWPEANSSRARADLRRTIYSIGKHLGAGILTANPETISVTARNESFSVDALGFRELSVSSDIDDLVQAAELYRGELLAGFTLPDAPAFEEWRYFQAQTLQQQAAVIHKRLVEWYMSDGKSDEAVEYTHRWLAIDPLDEVAHRKVMQLLAKTGRKSAALREFERYSTVLDDELGVSPSQEAVQLYIDIRDDAFNAQTETAAEALATSNLPDPPTHFVGRIAELAQAAELLADPDCRLLTIVGPGGIGKTRLAIELARAVSHQFADGVRFVDLTSEESPDRIATDVLRASGASGSGSTEPERWLIEYLADRRLLLVLDNFEHIIEGALLLPRLLRSAPGVKVLVTSRERLSLVEEWLLSLDGLESPPIDMSSNDHTSADDSSVSPVQLELYDATVLFMQSVRRVRPNYIPKTDDCIAILDICHMLGGMPLGIELSAAWSRTLSVREICNEISKGLDILATSMRDVPQRHRSMASVFDSSWMRLSKTEQAILRQMAVFRGGCTRQAAEQVTGARLDDLAQLVDKSWLRAPVDGRYKMHELVRQYCDRRLVAEHEEATGESEQSVCDRHSEYYAEYLRTIIPKMNFSSGIHNELVIEFANIRSAWTCALRMIRPTGARHFAAAFHFIGDTTGWFGLTIPLLQDGRCIFEQRLKQSTDGRASSDIRFALAIVYNAIADQSRSDRGELAQARRVLLSFLDMAEHCQDPTEQLVWRAVAGHQYANLLIYEGDYPAGYQAGQEAKMRFENPQFKCPFYESQRGRLFWLSAQLWQLGRCKMRLGEFSEADSHLQESIQLREPFGEKRFRGHLLEAYSRVKLLLGEYDRALKMAHEGLGYSNEFGDQTGIGQGQLAVGRALTALGQTGQAKTYLSDALETGNRMDHAKLQFESLTEMGWGQLQDGHNAEAKTRFREATSLYDRQDQEHTNYIVGVYLGLGWTALAEERVEEARDWFRTAMTYVGCTAYETMDAIAGMAEIAVKESRIETAVELLSLVSDHRYTAHALRKQANQRLHELERGMSADVFAVCLQSGSTLDVQEVRDELGSRVLALAD